MFRRLLFTAALAGLTVTAATAADRANVAALRGELQDRSQTRELAGAQAGALREQVANLKAELEALQRSDEGGQSVILSKRARLAALNAREAALRAQIDANQAALARLLGALELYRRSPPPPLLVSPGSARDAVRAAILIRAVEPELAARRTRVSSSARWRKAAARAVDALSEDLFTSESSLADERSRIEALIAQKNTLERQLDADAVDAGAGAGALTRQLRSLGEAPQSAGPAQPPRRMSPPVEGTVIRRYGQRTPGGASAEGMSWRGAAGAVVRAPAPGVVEYSGPLKGWGGVLIFNLGGGYHLVLAGLDRISIAAGASVSGGQTVGALPGGAAPELYLEVRKDGTPSDPAHWLSGSAPAGDLRR